MRPCWIRTALAVFTVLLLQSAARAQDTSAACGPYALSGLVRECTATGAPVRQLRTGTFIAGSEATGESVARAIGLEVATAPSASSSAGLTYTFDLSTRTFARRAGTFGPAFSERAVTIGKRKLSGGVSFLRRSYDRFDDLPLGGFDVFRFQEGTLPVTSSSVELQIHSDTVAGFAHYGLLDNLDIGIVVPYVTVSVKGVARIYGEQGGELQRVFMNAPSEGIGDIGIVAKWQFWQAGRSPDADDQVALAAAAHVRVPTGDDEALIGLGFTRTAVFLVGSGAVGRFSSHLNVGYEVWSDTLDIPRDFLGRSTIGVKDQIPYAFGVEWEAHPQLSVMFSVLGRYLRGGGGVGYQPFVFPQNFAEVKGAEALVAVPDGIHNLLLAPGAKWNAFRTLLVTVNVLVAANSRGLHSRTTPVIGLEWGF